MERAVFRAIGVLWVMAAGCGGSVTDRPSSEECLVNGDCAGSLVCFSGKCHEPCSSSRDCPAGSSCVQAPDGAGVCELAAEAKCQHDSDCAAPLVCSREGECRNQCLLDRDCVTGQVCTPTRVCAEPSEGVAGAGGVGGQGGAAGTAGIGGSTAPPPAILFSFASPDDCIAWAYGSFPRPDYDLTAESTITCDSSVGQPESPSLKVVAPFSAYRAPDQRIDLQFPVPVVPLDLTGRVISVDLKLDSGFVGPAPSSPGGVVLYARSGSAYDWGQASWRNLINPTDVGLWRKYRFDLSQPDPGSAPEFDPSQIQSIGIMIDTGNSPDPLVPPSTGTFHIDSIGYQ